jgi:hypothetical protein
LNNKTAGNHWIRKLVFAALIVEVAYVVLFNLALQLPLTQTLINQIRPEKFHITWENAWTWYPFRFHIRNATGNGQSRSQQWEFEVRSVSASIDALPLIFKRVWIDNVQVSDASYYQRPRLKPDRDYSELTAFYPPISGREVTDAVTTPKKRKRAWHVDIEDIRLDGQFAYWVHQFRGQARGSLEAELDVVSRGGLLSLSAPSIDLELDSHTISGAEMFQHGMISGELSLEPFVPRENRGIKMLPYVLLDAEIDIDINSLAFVNVFTRRSGTMKMDGAGKVGGRLHMGHAQVLDGTRLSVDAADLNVEFLSHMIKGDGTVLIEVGPDTGSQFVMNTRFNNMSMNHDGGGEPLFTGMGLKLDFKTANDLLQTTADADSIGDMSFRATKKPYELQLRIPAAHVADMSVFNYYFPPGSPFQFTSGTAGLTADILLEQDDAKGFMKLKADGMQAHIDEQQIQTDFSADFSLVDGAPAERLFDISGTEFRLDHVAVMGENDNFDQKDWATEIKLRQAEMIFTNPLVLKTEIDLSMTDSRPIIAMLGNSKDRPKWVKNMLIIEDVKGVAELDMSGNKVVIPNAFMDSDNIDFGAKGVFDEGLNDGVVYARYKKLDIVVKISEGKKNIDLIRARGKFDEYQLPGGIQ